MDKFDGDDMTVVIPADLDPGGKKLVLITHDETCFDSNDSKRSIWLEGENHALRPKGSGRSLMVSQFLCQCHGQMEVIVTEAMSAECTELKGLEGMKYESLRTIKPGKNADGYWTNKDLVEQTKAVQILFKILHPDCIAVAAFDNSQNHNAMAPDALVASRLNLSDGGAHVLHIRDGWFVLNDTRVIQKMQFDSPKGRLQKGVRRILQERELWPPTGLQLKEARVLLSMQPDFASQRSWLSETVAAYGNEIILYPKFHPEFNFIEMFWGATKKFTRKHCSYSFKDLERVVPIALKTTSVASIRRFARKCFRYMDAYRSKNGVYLSQKQIEWAMKKYKSHRCIPVDILDKL
jgi:hypothetical protein